MRAFSPDHFLRNMPYVEINRQCPIDLQMLELPDGGRVRMVRYGSEEPLHTMLYFHGFPGSHIEASFLHGPAAARSVAVIVLERYGLGGSQHTPGRTILDWPNTVLHAADLLGLERFSVFGISGGGPYALACALRIPERLLKVVVMSGVSPLDSAEVFTGMNLLARVVLKSGMKSANLAGALLASLLYWWRKRPGDMLAIFKMLLNDDDCRILSDPETEVLFKENVTEALRSGIRGAMREFKLLLQPWGFELSDITHPVVLWHGASDHYIPQTMGRLQAALIPRCSAQFIPGKGHFMAAEMADEILDLLIQDAGSHLEPKLSLGIG